MAKPPSMARQPAPEAEIYPYALPRGRTGVPSALGMVLLAGLAAAGYFTLSRPPSNPASGSNVVAAGAFELCSWY